MEVSLSGEGALLSLDRDRFKQIIVNLLGNCVRYTEQGGKIQIHTQQNEHEWVLYVDDSPFGVSDEQLARLGERFYRVDKARSRQTGGSGLGLAIVKHALHHHDSRLNIESEPGKGTRFSFVIPERLIAKSNG